MGHWGGVGDMVFDVFIVLLWTCFALPCAVSVFGFRDVGVCGAIFVVNTYFYIFIVVLVWVNLEPYVD